MLRTIPATVFAASLLAGCGESSPPDSPAGQVPAAAVDTRAAIAAAVAHPDRPEADRQRDEQRKPVEILSWFGVAPGMKVLDVFTGTGWYAEILARTVGPGGVVYAQNPPALYERIPRAEKGFSERLAGDRLPNVVRYERPLGEFNDLPAAEFDAAVIAMVFHDFFWLTDDVDGALADIYRVLKPGGIVLVTDHAAPDGTGADYAREFNGQHRIEESYAKQRFAAAGFELVGESELLRQPDDDRTKPFFDESMRDRYTDRFVLKLRKPAAGAATSP